MKFFRTLTRQFVMIAVLLLVFVGINTYSDFIFTHRMKGKAAGIDITNQLKSRAFEIAWMVERLAEREIVELDEQEEADLNLEVKNSIKKYDFIIANIRDGSREIGLKAMTDKEMLHLLDLLEDEWKKSMKPVLMKIIEMPASAPELERRRLVHKYDDRLYNYGSYADRLVGLQLVAYENDIRKFNIFRLFMLGIFCVSALGTVIFIRRSIVNPVKSLAMAARKIEKGNFDVNIAVKSSDEIGDLGNAFNRMAYEVDNLFGAMRWHSEDVMALNRALNKFVGIQDAEKLYQTISDFAHDLFSLKFSLVCMLNDENHDVKVASFSGLEKGALSNYRITWDESAYGAGPEGRAIKTNSSQVVNDLESEDNNLPGNRWALEQGCRSCMAVPLICANCAVVGVIVLYSGQKNHFSEDMIELCEIFVNHAASVIENVHLMKDLESRVQERTEELREALLIAESANAAKSAFLSNMSHDLRTPLNAIIGFSEAMSQGIYGELRPDHKEYMGYIYQSGIKLLKLINEILDLSKMESGDMELDLADCSVSEIINSALYIFREKAKKHRISIDTSIAADAAIINVDMNKIKQVLVNLLTDSLGAVSDGGEIKVSVSRTTRFQGTLKDTDSGNDYPEEDFIRIDISDTRQKMNENDRSMLFDPYEHFDTTIEGNKDSVGLHISKKFVELHGGRIWAEPLSCLSDSAVSGAGNRFVLVLPQKPPHGNVMSSGDKACSSEKTEG